MITSDIIYGQNPEDDIPLSTVVDVTYPKIDDSELHETSNTITLNDQQILDFINGQSGQSGQSGQLWRTEFIVQALAFAKRRTGIHRKRVVWQQRCAELDVLNQITNPTVDPEK